MIKRIGQSGIIGECSQLIIFCIIAVFGINPVLRCGYIFTQLIIYIVMCLSFQDPKDKLCLLYSFIYQYDVVDLNENQTDNDELTKFSKSIAVMPHDDNVANKNEETRTESGLEKMNQIQNNGAKHPISETMSL